LKGYCIAKEMAFQCRLSKKLFNVYDTNNKCIILNKALVIYTELNVLQFVLNVSQVVRVSSSCY